MIYNMDISAISLLSSNTILMVLMCAVVAVLVFYIEFMSGVDNKKSSAADTAPSHVDGVKSKKTSTTVLNMDDLQRPPGPRPFPIIGNLACMDGYEVPYAAFDDLAKKYGPIISLRLGSVPTVVVNGIENIKEVLITKSPHFDSRPNFRRYHELFSGNKQNSLAFCNWSDLQKMRREMLNQHTFPRNFSTRFQLLGEIIKNQMQTFVGDIQAKRCSAISISSSETAAAIEIKPIIMDACANIFTQYYCSRGFSSGNPQFQQMIRNYDSVFWEVNQGYAADFLPFLLPLHSKNLKRIEKCAHEIRAFILDNIIQDRFDAWTGCNDGQLDYVESLIDHVKRDAEPKMEWDTALFALEDILGGHSATGNFLVKIFGYIGGLPEVQQKIQQEIDATLAKKRTGKCNAIELSDRSQMPYTEAVIMEALRVIASPIVPHVASQDSSIGGYFIEKDSLIFLNNYNLSMSPELWDEPTAFKPERFIQNGHIFKPEHFLPFGAGRRSCMGYKMVQLISFSVLTSCMQHFSMRPPANVTHKVAVGSLAVPEKSYEMIFTERV